MKRIVCAFIVAVLLGACGTDNSSTVDLVFDGNGCLVEAGNFDWTEEWETATFLTVNYRWECAQYTSPLTGDTVEGKRVTLTFTGTACLQLTSELVDEGHCKDPKLI